MSRIVIWTKINCGISGRPYHPPQPSQGQDVCVMPISCFKPRLKEENRLKAHSQPLL